MSSQGSQLAIERSPGTALRVTTPAREVQEIWFGLSRMRWNSLALVPADEGGSAAGIATSLAEVGRRLRDGPVTFFIMADPIDYTSAGRFIAAVAPAATGESELNPSPTGKVIFAIQPVVVEPLGLAVTDAADAVVLCIEMGRSRIASVRRSMELIGRDRIAGCVLIR
jgi:hypothetical protein